MRFLPPTLKLPPTGWTLAGLLAFYVLAGLFGHDPWKTEDVIHLAVAKNLLDTGVSAGLSVAGSPFLSAPLYYWSAALTGGLFGGLLPLHDALRLASGLWMVLSLATVYYSSRELYGQESAAATPLLLAGSLGLIVRAHEAQPFLTFLSATGCLLLAFCLLPRKHGAAVFFLAAALVIAALGTGLSALFPMIFTLGLPFLIYRGHPALPPLKLSRLVFLALFGSLLFLASTVALLFYAAPGWTRQWLTYEIVTPSYFKELSNILGMLPWFSWPLLPLAAWHMWQDRRWADPKTFLPLSVFVLLLITLPAFFFAGETTGMLLLPALSLLATPGALTLRRGAASAFDWFSGMVFSVFAILLWVGWFAAVLGWPERLAERVVALEPGFVGSFSPFYFALALLATLWWVWTLITLPRSSYRCLTRWTVGLATVWLLTVSLWLPWIDYGKSYRRLSVELAAQLPKEDVCIAEWNLKEAQRASFAYFDQLHFVPIGADGKTPCHWLLSQGHSKIELTPPGIGWQRVWEGNRPGDRRERFRLYVRKNMGSGG